MKNRGLIFVAIGVLILYALATGVSYMVFNTFLKKPINISTPFGSLTDVTSAQEEGTKDRPCPLNGALYSKTREDAWNKRRPLAVMVENHTDARPIIGLSRSDIVYEAVAEGGITRQMALYLCQDAGDIAPVRSARTYFVDWLSEYSAPYAHVGGANTPGPANALGQIQDYDIMDMDQFGLGFPTYWRGTDKLAPHNVHTTTKKLWEAADKRGFTVEKDGKRWDAIFVKWQFKDEAAADVRGDQKPITVPFWGSAPDYTVTWKYDKAANVYQRFQPEGKAVVDPLTNETISVKNVIVQLETEKQANDGYPDGHLLYGTKGSGDALIFMDGKVTRGQWIKKDRISRTKYVDSKGKEIQLNRGLVWIETTPVGNKVDY